MIGTRAFLYTNLFILSCLFSVSDQIRATEFAVDQSFGSAGSVSTFHFSTDSSLYSSNPYLRENGRDVIQQNDGKLVAVSYAQNGTNKDFVLNRYNLDGSPDYSFGYRGTVVSDFNTGEDDPYNVIQQADGKLVVAGHTSGSIALARYLEDGRLDVSFGIRGKVVTPITLSGGTAIVYKMAMILQGDGKFVVGYWTLTDSKYDFLIVRYEVNGEIDSSFGLNGHVTVDFNGDSDTITDLIQQADGKLVALGWGGTGNGNGNRIDYILCRLDTDGSFDQGFGNGGKVVIDIGDYDYAGSILQLKNGNLVFSGHSTTINVLDYGVAIALLPDGAIDSSFGDQGFIKRKLLPSNKITELADGNLLFAGGVSHYQNGLTSTDAALMRYTQNGQIDDTFGSIGAVYTDINRSNNNVASMVIQQDGKIVLVGGAGSSSYTALIRYDNDGNLDKDFSSDGIVISRVGNAADYAGALLLQSDGKLVIAGYHKNYQTEEMSLARFRPNGQFDHNFAENGKASLDLGDLNSKFTTIIEQPDSKLIAIGHSGYGAENSLALARFTSTDGLLDSSFGTNGVAKTVENDQLDYVWQGIVQQDGKILLAGHTMSPFIVNDTDILLTRFNSDGSLDTTFSDDGEVRLDLDGAYDYAYDLMQLADGKLLVAGLSGAIGEEAPILIKFNIDGTIDADFGVAGLVKTPFGTGKSAIWSFAEQADGSILATGYIENNENRDFAVVRYLKNGEIDINFGVNGLATADFDSILDLAYSIQPLEGGKFLLAGKTKIGDKRYFALAQFLADGSLDPTFGDDGKYVVSEYPISTGDVSSAISNGDIYLLATSENKDTLLIKLIENVDTDSDGEFDPIDLDDDNDGLPDYFETAFGLDRKDASNAALDTDADGLTDTEEYLLGTDPSLQDTDNDGVNDKIDLFPLDSTDAVDVDMDGIGDNADTDDDNDGMSDEYEQQYGLDPLDASDANLDADNDGLTNLEEFNLGSDPNNVDTDGDGIRDGLDSAPLVALDTSVLDVNNNSTVDIMLLGSLSSGRDAVMLFDAVSGAQTQGVIFPGWFSAEQAEVISDINGNGYNEVVALGSTTDGKKAWLVFDSLTRALLSSVAFPGWFQPEELAVVPDYTGNKKDEVLVLGSTTDGKKVWMMHDAGLRKQLGVLVYPSWYKPEQVSIIDDTDGNGQPEVVSMGKASDGRVMWMLHDLHTRNLMRTVKQAPWYDYSQLNQIDDVSGNILTDLIWLGSTSDGKSLVSIEDANTGNVAKTQVYPSWYSPSELAIQADASGNGYSEIVTLGQTSDGKRVWMCHDSDTGAQLAVNGFPQWYQPGSLKVIADVNGDDVEDIVVTGITSDGKTVMMVQDGANGITIRSKTMPRWFTLLH